MDWWLILIIVLAVFIGVSILLYLLKWGNKAIKNSIDFTVIWEKNIIHFRLYTRRGRFNKTTKITGKIVLITGANTGIGKETAIDLAKRGGKIYIACRDAKRGEDAVDEIKSISGNDNVFYMQLDLGSLESIRHFSNR